jgi:uncharacterized protein (DUF3084 family)
MDYAKQTLLKRLTSLRHQIQMKETEISIKEDEIAKINKDIEIMDEQIHDLELGLEKLE